MLWRGVIKGTLGLTLESAKVRPLAIHIGAVLVACGGGGGLGPDWNGLKRDWVGRMSLVLSEVLYCVSQKFCTVCLKMVLSRMLIRDTFVEWLLREIMCV